MIESLHTGMMVNVRNGGEVSDRFARTSGVKQGCVPAPTLFSIFLSAMLEEAFKDMGDGIYIQSRQNAVQKLHAIMMRHLRSIMKIRWQDKVTNKKVHKRAGLPSMEDLLIRKNLRWTGHLLRMPTDRLPRQVLYSQLPDGQRPRGGPRLRYKDTIKRNLKKRDIDTNSWKSLSLQRDVWRDTVK